MIALTYCEVQTFYGSNLTIVNRRHRVSHFMEIRPSLNSDFDLIAVHDEGGVPGPFVQIGNVHRLIHVRSRSFRRMDGGKLEKSKRLDRRSVNGQ